MRTKKGPRIRRYAWEEIGRLPGRTNVVRVARATDKEILEQVLRDPDLAGPADAELKEFRPARLVLERPSKASGKPRPKR